MTRPITPDALSDCFDEEFSWRRREISFLKTWYKQASFEEKGAIGRASYMALYAHWEGFVRESCQLYLHHISFRNLQYKDMRTGIMLAANPSSIAGIRSAGDNFVLAAQEVDKLAELTLSRFKNEKPEVNTRSNLGYEILEEIDCLLGGIGMPAAVDRNSLNKILLKKRNTVAHGRHTPVDYDEFCRLVDDVTGWMQAIKSLLLNAAIQKSYLRPAQTTNAMQATAAAPAMALANNE